MRGAARAAFLGAVAAVGTALTTGSAPAWADPVDPLIPLPAPVDPSVPPPAAPAPVPAALPTPQSLLGQFAQSGQANPLSIMTDILAGSPQPAAVGMAPPPPGTAPASDPFAMAQMLKPQNFRMPTDDQVSPYALAPNDNPSPFARIDAFKGVHALAHSNLGRMPGDELGQALPGTAPPPGTNLPPGLEQYYIDPAATPPPVTSPVDPLLIPVTPPN